MMKPKLCAAGETLRDSINEHFPHRDKKSDGWIGDARHQRAGTSDHLPHKDNGYVRAIDVDANLDTSPNTSSYLADQIRECAKRDKRISYVIHLGKIASRRTLFRWTKYKGISPHNHHIHISFTEKGDKDASPFKIPMLGE